MLLKSLYSLYLDLCLVGLTVLLIQFFVSDIMQSSRGDTSLWGNLGISVQPSASLLEVGLVSPFTSFSGHFLSCDCELAMSGEKSRVNTRVLTCSPPVKSNIKNQISDHRAIDEMSKSA